MELGYYNLDIICLAPPRFQAPVLVVPGKTPCVFHGNRPLQLLSSGASWMALESRARPSIRPLLPCKSWWQFGFFHHEYQPKIGNNGKNGMVTGSHIFATLQCLTSSAKQYHVKACTCSTDVVSADLLAASSEAPTQDEQISTSHLWQCHPSFPQAFTCWGSWSHSRSLQLE